MAQPMKASNSVLAHGTASGEDIEWYEVIDGVRVERESMGVFEMVLASWRSGCSHHYDQHW
jgi:hypothetical protein